MRVAVYEPRPRTCGVTSYSFHVRDGFRALGHEADVVSFTKSGKPRRPDAIPNARLHTWNWWTEACDVYARLDEAHTVFDGYDLIYLNEPKHGSLDREAVREGKKAEDPNHLPTYIEILQKTKTPWMSALHAPLYQPAKAPFLAEALSAGNFLGKLIVHQQGTDEGMAPGMLDAVSLLPYPWVPYVPSLAIDAPLPPLGRVITHGRFTENKGGPTVAAVAETALPEGWELEMHGAVSGGNGPSSSYVVFEVMNNNGWRGERKGQLDYYKYPKDEVLNNWGDIISGWPWYVEKDGRRVSYHGGYLNGVEVAGRGAVACALTSPKFARGFELTALEAIDAGSTLVMPAYALWADDNHRVRSLQHFERTLTMGQTKTANQVQGQGNWRWDRFSPAAKAELIQGVRETCEATRDNPTWRQEVVQHNREVLRSHHDPATFAQYILDNARG